MPLTYAELLPFFKEIVEKGVLELEWKPKRKRPNVSIDATISQISESMNEVSCTTNAQSVVAKHFEFDDEANEEEAGGESSFASKRMLTSGAMKPRAKPAPTSMNKILSDLKKQQQSANTSGNASNLSFNQPNEQRSAHMFSPGTNPGVAAEFGGGAVEASRRLAPVAGETPHEGETLPGNVAAASVETQSNAGQLQSQVDAASANTQSQQLETLDLTISASQDCF